MATTNYEEVLTNILVGDPEFALATAVDDVPNVRIISGCYDPKRPGIIFFLTDNDSPKTVEFEKNSRVAIATVPQGPMVFARCNDAIVKKAEISVEDLWDALKEQVYGFEQMYAAKGERMQLYTIELGTVSVQASMQDKGVVTF